MSILTERMTTSDLDISAEQAIDRYGHCLCIISAFIEHYLSDTCFIFFHDLDCIIIHW